MKSADVNSSTYIDFGAENIDKDTKFVVADQARISKQKSIFAKVYALDWSEEVFVI